MSLIWVLTWKRLLSKGVLAGAEGVWQDANQNPEGLLQSWPHLVASQTLLRAVARVATAAELLRQVQNMERSNPFFIRACCAAFCLASGSKKLIPAVGDGKKAGTCKRMEKEKWGQELGVKGWLLGSVLPQYGPWASRNKLWVWIKNRYLLRSLIEGSDDEIRKKRYLS